jgi:hypothetical protein
VNARAVMASTFASIAPGCEDADKLAATKASSQYWANKTTAAASKAA